MRLLCCICFSLCLGWVGAQAKDAKSDLLQSKIQLESSPPERTGPLAGYADTVSRVSPSVVSIFTSKKVTRRTLDDYPFLFEDPFFRRFFSEPGPGPREPRRSEPREELRQGLGSGVILTPDGYIVTNNHVIDGADEIEVALADNRKTYSAEVIGKDPATDLALIKIDRDDLPAITVGDSSTLKPGDTVLAIGNPFGLDQTVTSGIVSATGRKNLTIADYSNFIQTDASINPGNSGGALIDNRGRLMGINTAIFSRSGGNVGIGFAIPSNMAIDVLGRLLSDGEVQRGYLGVMLSEVTPELARGFGVEPGGALVNDVLEDTPAGEAGFKPGDVIQRYRGKEVADMAELRLSVANTRPGTEADFDIVRNGKKKTLKAKIGKLPSNDRLASGRGWNDDGSSDEFLPGVRISDLDERTRSYYRVPDDIEGVIVLSVEPDSNAALARISEGDVITAVGGTSIGSVRDALEAKKDVSGGVVVLRVVNSRGARFVAIELEE